MSERNQPNIFSLMSLMRVLLTVALAVFLMSTLAVWVMGLPVQAASAASEAVVPTSISSSSGPSPTLAVIVDSPSPLATPEPTTVPTTVAPTTTPPADQPTDQLAYTVQEGDTLGTIAQAYGVSVNDLVAANSIADPDLLYVGQTLIISDGSSIGSTVPISATTQEPNPTTEVPSQPTPAPAPASPEGVNEERWIDVDLSQQLLTASCHFVRFRHGFPQLLHFCQPVVGQAVRLHPCPSLVHRV